MKSSFALTLTFLLFGLCFANAKQPNILWIVTDDQRGDSLACVNEATLGKSGLRPEEKQQTIRDHYAFCAYGDSLIEKAVKRFREVSEQAGQE